MAVSSTLLGRLLGLPPARTRVRVDRDLPIAMPDGAKLLADRWYPASAGGSAAPIVLVRTPYGRRGLFGVLFRAFAERDYQVVVVSTRGTFGSGGDWVPFRDEQRDGAAVLEWLAAQPWFVPNVATTGASYFGLTQWAVAADPPPWLKAMALGVTSSWFRDIVYPGDVFALESLISWVHEVEHQEEGTLRSLLSQARGKRAVAAAATAVPLGDADTAAVGHHVQFFQDWLEHEDRQDPWWGPIDFSPAAATVPPAVLVAGWYDLFLPYQLEDFKRLRAAGRTVRLVVGPWTHTHPKGLAALARETLDWVDRSLRRPDAPADTDIRVELIGGSGWRSLPEWPPASTPTRYHLDTRFRLTTEPPAAAAPDTYRYDPRDPTPSVGGASLALATGPRDNRKREARPDVLCYTTDVLADDITVIGEISAELYLRSSLEHTDFFVRLCDVHPDGKSINISDGIVRLPAAAPQHQDDGSWKVTIAMFPTAAVFRRGHRIRLQVSSGAHPLFARNTGSGEPVGKATTMRVAEQQVLHDPDHPSAITLPVA